MMAKGNAMSNVLIGPYYLCDDKLMGVKYEHLTFIGQWPLHCNLILFLI